ncbi:hypothetical protein BS17DRAFT_790703 [Gyrodon lividus]|nr:hypothetical protein BS17DRAFT_790703 [Gyrodon lividus]
MLREITFPVRNNRLPWYTLEDDLRTHGYAIINWPSGVPRENDKGVYTLSAAHVDKLYFALTQAGDADRLRFVSRVDGPTGTSLIAWCDTFLTAARWILQCRCRTDLEECMTPVRNAGRSKRRVKVDHYDRKGKRMRFKVTTAEYYADHVSADG